MGARDYWDRMLVYFGIAEEAYDEEGEEWAEEQPATRSSRRSARAQSRSAVDEYEEPAPAPRRAAPRRPAGGSRPRTAPPSRNVAGVGIVPPKTFNDAQQIADQLKVGNPVIVDLQSSDAELSRRVIDFASGLTYGLDGRMQPIAEKVFLLTPPDVDVSAEDRAAMLEGGFFNQS